MREQIAQQPPSRSGGHSIHDAPPWISQLDTRVTSRSGGEAEPKKQPERRPSTEDHPPEQRDHSSHRALHVKVWDEEDSNATALEAEKGEVDPARNDGMEMLPTRPLAASTPAGAAAPRNDHSPAARAPRDAHVDEVEQLDTVPLATPKPSRSQQTPWPSTEAYTPPRQRVPQNDLFAAERTQAYNPASPIPYMPPQAPAPAGRPVNPQSGAGISQPGLGRQVSQPGIGRQVSPPGIAGQVSQPGIARQVAAPPRMPASKPAHGKRTLVVTAIVLVVLVIAGTIAFVVVKQPFSVASVTQPQQTFTSTQLGFTVHYPNGWASAINAAKGTATFQDSSQTDQFIVVVAANTGSPGQYLQQEANKLGMTNTQTNLPALSFAGSSWQQIKGNVLVRGASYTETLLATAHGNNLYVIMQLAPQTTYIQEEQLVFSSMRSSFQFS